MLNRKQIFDAITMDGILAVDGTGVQSIINRLMDLQSQNLQQTDCYAPLRGDIEHTVEYYKQKLNTQASVGDYSTALMCQHKISALEDVLVVMKQSNGA